MDWWYNIDKHKLKKNLKYLGASLIAAGAYLTFFNTNTYKELTEMIEAGEVELIEAEVTYFKETREHTSITSSRRRTVCDLEYTYDYRGDTYVGLSSDCAGSPDVGDSIEIYVEKDDPWNDYMVSDADDINKYYIFLPVIGAVMVVAGFAIREF
jgi:hypothetical protein